MMYRFNGQQVAVREGVTLTFVYGDHLGSASLTTNITGTKVSEVRYYPFGETRYSSGTTSTPKRFNAKEQQTDIGLYDYGARFFDPAIGRFVSADSVVSKPGNPQNLDRYAYTLNNPLKYIDPTGHDVGCAGASAETCSGWYKSWSSTFTYWNSRYESTSWDSYNGALKSYYYYQSALAYVMLEDGYQSERYLAEEASVADAQLKLLYSGGFGEQAANKALWNAGMSSEGMSMGGASASAGLLTFGNKIGELAIRFVDAKIRDRKGNVIAEGIVDLQPTVDRVNAGIKDPHDNDGTTYKNLPNKKTGVRILAVQVDPDYYKEYVIRTPGITTPGPQRLIVGADGDVYYTPDHYVTAIQVRQK